jgi:hypothetical protein
MSICGGPMSMAVLASGRLLTSGFCLFEQIRLLMTRFCAGCYSYMSNFYCWLIEQISSYESNGLSAEGRRRPRTAEGLTGILPLATAIGLQTLASFRLTCGTAYMNMFCKRWFEVIPGEMTSTLNILWSRSKSLCLPFYQVSCGWKHTCALTGELACFRPSSMWLLFVCGNLGDLTDFGSLVFISSVTNLILNASTSASFLYKKKLFIIAGHQFL